MYEYIDYDGLIDVLKQQKKPMQKILQEYRLDYQTDFYIPKFLKQRMFEVKYIRIRYMLDSLGYDIKKYIVKQ